jgi:hypothetical protein
VLHRYHDHHHNHRNHHYHHHDHHQIIIMTIIIIDISIIIIIDIIITIVIDIIMQELTHFVQDNTVGSLIAAESSVLSSSRDGIPQQLGRSIVGGIDLDGVIAAVDG